MKQSDIFSIVIIALVGTLASFFGVNAFLGDPDMNWVEFSDIEEVSATVQMPNPEIFNLAAINPTVEVYVGNCEDIDHNGILTVDELKACGLLESDGTIEVDEDEEDVNEDDDEGN